MSSSTVPPVAVGVDYPAGPSRALDWAAQEALARSSTLLLVTGWTGSAHHDPALLREGFLESAVRRLLEKVALDTELAHPGLFVRCAVVDADAREALERQSADVQLMVLGAHRSHSVPERLLGSTTLHIAAVAHCPVVVVPEDPYAGLSVRGVGPIVLGVDGHEPARAAAAFAFETAVREEATLRAVHAWRRSPSRGEHAPLPPSDEIHATAEQDMRLYRALAPWRARYPEVELQPETVHAGAARGLVRFSRGARLVVVGRHGHPTGPLGRLGSVSQSVVQHARCPIAVVPCP